MRLKLDHTQTVLAVAGALLIVLNIYLFATYLSAKSEKDTFETQYNRLEATLLKLTASNNEPIPEPGFPQNSPGIELSDLVIRSARENGTEVLALHSSAIGTEAVGAGVYRVVKLNLRVRAEPSRMNAFLARLESGDISTLVIDNLELRQSGSLWEADLNLIGYSQPG